jgi:micrococcal nuclease
MRRRDVRLVVAATAILVALAISWGAQRDAAEPPRGISAGQAATAVATRTAGTGDRATAAPRVAPATVVKHVDGDTLHVTMADGSREKVRFIGVNTPESTIEHEPYGKEASAYTKRRLPLGTRVWLETDVELRDRYGRLLAYVWLRPPQSGDAHDAGANMFNAELLSQGYAQLMTIPPDVRYVDAFRPLQAGARAAGRGLWGLP